MKRKPHQAITWPLEQKTLDYPIRPRLLVASMGERLLFALFFLGFFIALPSALLAASVQNAGDNYEFIPEETDMKKASGVLSKEPKYAVLVAADGNELKGFVSIDDEGGIRLTGNTHLPDPYVLKPEEIRSLRLLPKVVIRKKKTQQVVLGYVLRDLKDRLVIETLLEPKAVEEIPKNEIDNVIKVKSVVVHRKDNLHRLGIEGAYLSRQSGLAAKVSGGFGASLSYDLDAKQLFGWETLLIPHIRARASFLQMNDGPYRYQSIAPQIGLMWFLRPYHKKYGYFYTSLLAAGSFESVKSPLLAESALTIAATGEFGYEIPLGNFFLFLGAKVFVSPDKSENLIAPGGHFGLIYGF